MTFTALRFEVGAQHAESWSDALIDAGAMSVDLTDPRADTADETPLYDEPGERGAELWPLSSISALFAADADVDAALREAAAAIGAVTPRCERYPVAEQDWVRETQRQFAPIQIGQGFWVVPSWCEAPDRSAINLKLDPGLAFGTGSHPTTFLCLAWMRECGVKDLRVLDYGCGSGILAIAAAKLGAREVRGIDVDPQAVRASNDNARNNDVDAQFSLPDSINDSGYDIVVANILANPLIVLAPALSARVRGGGRIALAGILDARQDAVAEAYAHWFTLAPWRHADGWVLLHGERRAND